MTLKERNQRKVRDYLKSHRAETKDWARIKRQRLEVDDLSCQKCGMNFREWDCAEVHHIYGRSDDRLESLMSFCRLCHPGKQGEEFWEWLREREGPLENLERKIRRILGQYPQETQIRFLEEMGEILASHKGLREAEKENEI